jgi:hypothetical protein
VWPSADRALTALLLSLHVGLFVWALAGWSEWLLPAVPWPAVSNPLFPRWLLFAHWSAVLLAATLFLGGYRARWRRTPAAMIPAYAFMAAVCLVETFFFLVHPLRFVALALELVAYVAIPVALHRLPSFVARFALRSPAAG